MCEYCEKKTNNILTERGKYAVTLGYNDFSSFCPYSGDLRLVELRDSEIVFVHVNFPINYCPVCGRYLGEE